MVTEAIRCPTCGQTDIYRHGHSATGKKRYICRNVECTRKTFIIDYTNKGYLPSVKEKIVDIYNSKNDVNFFYSLINKQKEIKKII